jgi:hypothetical protein
MTYPGGMVWHGLGIEIGNLLLGSLCGKPSLSCCSFQWYYASRDIRTTRVAWSADSNSSFPSHALFPLAIFLYCTDT